jgi:integrase
MFTDPDIVTSPTLQSRSYVKVYIDGQRHRFYNGNAIGIACFPNNAKTVKDRQKLLTSLCYHLKSKLQDGWLPGTKEEAAARPEPKPIAIDSISHLLKEIENQDLSRLYKRDLAIVGKDFIAHLWYMKMQDATIDAITSEVAESFLKQYNHSATYYMNKRRTLGAIFSKLVHSKVVVQNPLSGTKRLKEKATLHQAYNQEQLRAVLLVLAKRHPHLHLCALLMYGCFLRPHQEIRQLFRRDFKHDFSTISLGGNANKSGRVRTVFVPPYVRESLQTYDVTSLSPEENIFTRSCDVYNECYFNTAWSRIKEDLLKDGTLGQDHTLYSFRHTAAVNLYMKTKDLYKVQQAMAHSSMTVTLTYMRSLGLVNNLEAEDAPEL